MGELYGVAPGMVVRATLRCFGCGLAVALFLTGILPAQSDDSSDLQDALAIPSACASLASNGPHADALRKVCEYAVSLPQRIPNFTCEQRTSRYSDGHAADVVTAIVTYEDGKESYHDIRSNGTLVTDVGWLNSHTWSTGQFGADIRGLFEAGNKVSFQLVNDDAAGSDVLVFEYQIAQQDVPFWRLHMRDFVAAPPYHGKLFIDKKTGALRRLQVASTELPQEFPLRSADLLIDYGSIPFGDGTSFSLPRKTVVSVSDRLGQTNRNVLQFHNCHKFRATARMLPQADTHSSPPDRL